MALAALRVVEGKRRPLVYFRGTLEEARGLSNRELLAAFESGFGRKASILGRFRVGGFRKAMLWHLDELAKQRASESNARTAVLHTPHGPVAFRMTHARGRFLVHALPLSHWVTTRASQGSANDPLKDVHSIIRGGFKSGFAHRWNRYDANVTLDSFRNTINFWYGLHSERPELKGDVYGLEFFSALDRRDADARTGPHMAMVRQAPPEGLRRVNVRLPGGLTQAELARRHDFYAQYFGPVPFLLHVPLATKEFKEKREALIEAARKAIPQFRLRFYDASM